MAGENQSKEDGQSHRGLGWLEPGGANEGGSVAQGQCEAGSGDLQDTG